MLLLAEQVEETGVSLYAMRIYNVLVPYPLTARNSSVLLSILLGQI